jgi:hypothetical protein
MMARYLNIPVLSLFVLLTLVPTVIAKTVDVPSGSAAVIDGTMETAEWADGVTFDLTGGGKLLLKHDRSFLYAGLRGSRKGWCHFYLSRGNDRTVEVLHASAALGRTVYTRDDRAKWQPSNPFSWELRERVLNEDAKKKFDAYLSRNGWVASNSNMGNPEEIEFKIKLDRGTLRIAAVYAFEAKGFQYFPASLADDSLKSELVVGNTPVDLSFDPKQWVEINLMGVKK